MTESSKPFQYRWQDALKASSLKANARCVGMMLQTYGNADGRSIFPGSKRLEADTALGERGVRTALKDLRGAGLIVQTSASNGGQGRATEYRLAIPSREEHPAPETPVRRDTHPQRHPSAEQGDTLHQGGQHPAPEQVDTLRQSGPTSPSTNPSPDQGPEQSLSDGERKQRDELLDQVRMGRSSDGLKRLHAEHRSVFDKDPDLLSIWKERGRELEAVGL